MFYRSTTSPKEGSRWESKVGRDTDTESLVERCEDGERGSTW